MWSRNSKGHRGRIASFTARFHRTLHAGKFKTPTLVIHGQLDDRLDVAEGFQLLTTLQRLKLPSKVLYFPNEGLGHQATEFPALVQDVK